MTKKSDSAEVAEDKKDNKTNAKKIDEKSKVLESKNKDKKEDKKVDKVDIDIKEDDVKDALKVQKDSMGLEELPEDIKKKLEKKKAEVSKISKAKKGKVARKKKKAIRRVSSGRAYIKATYNNTIVTLTDEKGNVLSWASAGIAGFKGPKKSTPYAAQIITRIAVGKAREANGLSEVSVFVRGVGTGRESAIRALNSNGLLVTSIKDVTPVPHNGCRQRKPRRV